MFVRLGLGLGRDRVGGVDRPAGHDARGEAGDGAARRHPQLPVTVVGVPVLVTVEPPSTANELSCSPRPGEEPAKKHGKSERQQPM